MEGNIQSVGWGREGSIHLAISQILLTQRKRKKIAVQAPEEQQRLFPTTNTPPIGSQQWNKAPYSRMRSDKATSLEQVEKELNHLPNENEQLTQEVIHEVLKKLLIANPKQDDKIIEWIEVKCLH